MAMFSLPEIAAWQVMPASVIGEICVNVGEGV